MQEQRIGREIRLAWMDSSQSLQRASPELHCLQYTVAGFWSLGGQLAQGTASSCPVSSPFRAGWAGNVLVRGASTDWWPALWLQLGQLNMLVSWDSEGTALQANVRYQCRQYCKASQTHNRQWETPIWAHTHYGGACRYWIRIVDCGQAWHKQGT